MRLQTTMNKFFTVHPVTISVKCSQRDIEDSAVCLVTVDGRPFAAVEDTGYQALLQPLIRGMNLGNYAMNRHKVRNLVEEYAERMRKEIAEFLSKKKISLKVDCATKNRRSFLGINSQVRKNGKLFCINLAVRELKERHTSENLRNAILDELKRFNLNESNIYSITSDNGSNILKMVKILNKPKPNANENSVNTDTTNTTNDSNLDDDFSIAEISEEIIEVNDEDEDMRIAAEICDEIDNICWENSSIYS